MTLLNAVKRVRYYEKATSICPECHEPFNQLGFNKPRTYCVFCADKLSRQSRNRATKNWRQRQKC